MARYRFKINTDSYKCKRCSKKNWEPGTMNDYMLAIYGDMVLSIDEFKDYPK